MVKAGEAHGDGMIIHRANAGAGSKKIAQKLKPA
jgi:hypothetical protein